MSGTGHGRGGARGGRGPGGARGGRSSGRPAGSRPAGAGPSTPGSRQHRGGQRGGQRTRTSAVGARQGTGTAHRVAVPVPAELVAGRSSEAAEDAETVAANDRRALWLVSSRAAVAGVLAGLVAGVVVGVVAGAAAGLAAGLAAVVAVGAACGVFARWAGAALPVRSLGARAPGPDELPRLRNLVEGLCATMGVEPPEVLVVDHPGANALALARPGTSSCLVVTAGLEPSLSVVELEAVLAHELVRVKLHDTVVAAAALAVTAPLAGAGGRGAARVRALLGPARAFRADRRAAAVVRYPPGLAAALERMLSVAAATRPAPAPWDRGRVARCTRPLWVDPVGGDDDVPRLGNLDHTAVRAAALGLE